MNDEVLRWEHSCRKFMAFSNGKKERSFRDLGLKVANGKKINRSLSELVVPIGSGVAPYLLQLSCSKSKIIALSNSAEQPILLRFGASSDNCYIREILSCLLLTLTDQAIFPR